ncbi:MAG: hypothetical protein FJW30_29945 [Acidobacteria bacterium]|nr:hypothetical protein [Acidobacteriota bacterium]
MSVMWLAMLANAAPLLGFALWLTPFSFTGGAGWDFPKAFSIGIYMAFAGLVVPVPIWAAAAPGLAKTEALTAIKFHALIASIVLAFVLAALIASHFDPPKPTLADQPGKFLAVLTLFFATATFVLPFVELARAAVGVYRVLTAFSKL